MEEGHTGITFNNKLVESDSINFLTNQYIYIGSGVGIADFNNDGLQDIFFAGEQVSSKLYINKGDFKFEDVTEKAGLTTNKWCTGVSIVDINNDGLQDIYVSVSHSADPAKRGNLLFINQSDTGAGKSSVKFSELASDYGLDDKNVSTQAAFFDYDKDGDLDMYLMNHNVFQNQLNNIVYTDAKGSIREFIRQRKRWASKSTRYKDKRIVTLGISIWLFNLLILINLSSGFYNPVYWQVGLIALLFKFAAETAFLVPVTAFAKRQKLLWFLPLLTVIHIVYIVYIGVAGNSGKYIWKGRLVK